LTDPRLVGRVLVLARPRSSAVSPGRRRRERPSRLRV